VNLSTRLAVISMNDVTVPQEQLPAGCTLASKASIDAILDATRVQGGVDRPVIANFWGSHTADAANPWITTNPSTIAHIRERLSASPLLSDPTGRLSPELLAKGVEEAYIAVYANQSDLTKPVVVYALRFSATEEPPFYPPSNSRFEIGPINGIVSGEDGQCAHAVETYLKSLAR
jgi:hypothetical protein